ncbi:amidase [Dyadobacter sp. 676]|uniref:Amidase n=1 Tax=Dyadobacter sp. 676 TaxID=3088362 RepID=A0AAU8FGP6_9BACT
MKRRNFIRIGTAAGLFAAMPAFAREAGNASAPGEYAELTIAEMQKRMQAGRLTAVTLTQYYLGRIAKIDKAGPKLASVIEVNPDALRIAASLDKERKSGKVRGPLHGIPVLLKDNIDTADQMKTTAGSLALLDNVAPRDAFLVARLREAGAVILGKTNLSEWANFRSTRSSSGWSSRGGQTRNPYVLDRSPCGSSSGSAVAVAANLCAVAVGTETNGSIACPASMNGIVGIKPTVGLVSRSGVIPISKTQDTAGPFGRTVADAAVLLGAIAGKDPADPTQHKPQKPFPADYTVFLDADGLKGKRIGVEKTMLKMHEAIDPLLQKALEQLKAGGAEIVEIEYMKIQKLPGAESAVLQYEFKDGINRYLASSNAKIKSLEALIAFNKANRAKVMPYFGQELFESSQAKGDLGAREYKEALAKINGVADAISDLLDKERLDALCGPSTGPAWCTDPVNGDFWTGYGSYGPAALSGFPSITLPMGTVSGLPVGISFLAKAYQEPELIRIAYAYEQMSRNRVEPGFRRSVG